MKKFGLLAGLYLFSTAAFSAAPIAMFSPYEGKEAFNKMYSNIQGAQKTAHLTIYSWSDAGITKAMKTLLIENPEVKLRVVLHRPLANKEKTLKKVAELEKLGAMFKKAKMNMHEKYVLVDSKKLVNSSANMSGGAKNKYNEDFVFIDSDGEASNEALITSFEKEFSILWNTSDDIVSEGEKQKADVLAFNLKEENVPVKENSMSLISSSMNFKLSKNKVTSADFKKGRVIKMRQIKPLDQYSYTVAKNLIEAIDNATESIWMSVNHFNLYSVSEALVRAVKRNVEIRLYVDNQEFKTNIRDTGRKSIEMTPRFVRDFKKIPGNKKVDAPVRVKFYSHAPHHSSWFLNHHKYILIDYNEKDTSSTVLLAGSYNISKNAELKQFDNLVKYTTTENEGLFHAYANNHKHNWNLNRNSDDRPAKAALAKFTQVHKDSYVLIHAKKAADSISLTWSEAKALKKKIGKVAPGFFKGLFQNKACYGYNFVEKQFFGGKSCTK
jgi:phosphatidylserine/phosphatidylglycerophosphate/cardiolipin synthase-like enzyme